MFKSSQIGGILNDFFQKFPRESLPEFSSDLRSSLRVHLENTLAKLHLVTREEFDVQTQILARTRAKLEALEKVVDGLTKTLPDEQTPSLESEPLSSPGTQIPPQGE